MSEHLFSERPLTYVYEDELERLRRIERAARAFAAVHNPECPVSKWTPESRTLRICHCGHESLRAALEAV